MNGTAEKVRLTTEDWLARAAAIAPRTEAFIDGRFVAAASGETFADVAGRVGVAREEIFGPVLTVTELEDEADALRIANDSPFGLAAGIWTRHVKRAHRLARAIRAGTVWINTFDTADITVPYGGFKQSGFGREKGMAALDGYSQLKTTWLDLSGG